MTLFDDKPVPATEEILDRFWDGTEDKPLTPGRYHASSVMQCYAKHYFARVLPAGSGREFPQGIGERGRRAEDYVREAFVKEFGADEVLQQVKTQREIAPGLTVSGKVDVMVIGYNLRPRKILEVKSQEGSPFGDVKKHYEFQALFYDWVYQPTEGTEVVVVNTGDYEDRKVYPVKWTPQKMVEFIDYWQTVDSQFHEGGKPIPEPFGGWECWFPKKNKGGKIDRVVTCPYYKDCPAIGGPKSPVPENLAHLIEGNDVQ